MSNKLPNGWTIARIREVIEDFQPGFASGEKNVETGISHLRMNKYWSRTVAVDIKALCFFCTPFDLPSGSVRHRHRLHFTGNSVSLYPAFQRYDDVPGSAVSLRTNAFANISGNTLLAGEHGIVWQADCTNALVLKNDFGAASSRALDHRTASGSARTVQILKNVLNQGNSYHLKLGYPDSGAFFLRKNIYTNGVSNVEPLLDAAASPVHIMR